MKMDYCSDIPRTACRGTYKECAGVVNEVGDDHLHEFLWERGSLRRTWSGCPQYSGSGWACRGRPRDCGHLLDFDPVSVPKLVSAPEQDSDE